MEARRQIADFLSALLNVYTLIIFGWIIVSWVLSFGVRIPYSRPVNAVLDFLRDVTNPFLRIFRRLGLQFGPIDFSPIVAILVLRIGGGLLVGLIDPGPGAGRVRRCAPGSSRWRWWWPTRSRRRSCAARSGRWRRSRCSRA